MDDQVTEQTPCLTLAMDVFAERAYTTMFRNKKYVKVALAKCRLLYNQQ